MDEPSEVAPRTDPRRRPRRVAPGLAQLPWRSLANPFRPLEILSTDQVEAIHRASLRILSEIGMEVLGDRALEALARAGATVDRGARRVRLDPAQVESLIATAPSLFRLHARNRDRDLVFGGANLVFGAVGGPAFVSDLDRGRRAGNFADFVDYVRLIGALDIIHQEGGGPLEPTDLPVETRHLDMYRTFALELDKTWQCLGYGARPVDDAIEVVSLIRGVDRDALLREPSLMTVINTNSPLRLDGPMSEGLMEMALHGQPVVATPFTLAGAMSPVSLAGALAQQNAEALFLVALSQIVRPGAPMVYGAFTSNVDMRTGAPAFGTPESVKGAIASGQLARRYGLPWRSSNTTASNVVDAQAAYESEMAVWGALMGGVNLLYQGAGWLEGGLTASYEKLIIDAEILQMLSEVLQPLQVDEASLAIEAIADVGPGGHFFGTAHTLERYQTAFYRPLLSDWRNFEAWQADGARTATERANTIWKRLLAEATPPGLDPPIAEALDAFVARRKREIASDS
ncbi:MAG TPA: trimethylamine methyltransferase family protein [Candidatus Limnocylindrales bacterium]|nr:trimethylamine methyltransferase family protein [Candidatus Limnocylindrales bacterium]